MKRIVVTAATVFMVVLMLTGCISLEALFPGVNEPVSPASSMLVLEAGRRESDGSTSSLEAANYSAWVPWVEDASGRLIEFRHVTSVARVDSVMYRENLDPGTYTLKGFIHVYTDFGKLEPGVVTIYGPYEDYAHDVKQFLPLENPVKLNLQPGRMDSFGRYAITYDYFEGFAGSSDDRYRVIPERVRITADPTDRRILQVMKNWATPRWSLWNERNPEQAIDY